MAVRSKKPHDKKAVGAQKRARAAKPANGASFQSETKDEDDEHDRKHVADLIARGLLKPGKRGPPIPELLEPGPRVPGASKLLTEERRLR